MSLNQRFHRTDDGAVAIVVALCSVVLLGVGALAVDVGNLYAVRRESQRTADLAALAGAQNLPTDALGACQKALEYLDNNRPGGGTYGVNSLLCTPVGTPDGTVTISADFLSISVKVPDQKVSFGFATVLGYRNGYTAAGATVEIRSPGAGTLPFGMTAAAAASGGEVCLKFGSGSSDNDLCKNGSSSGNFAYLDIPRVTNNNKSLLYDLKYGADHGFAAYTSPPANTQCANSSGKAVDASYRPDTSPPYADNALPNCLPTQTGNKTSTVQDGLIDGKFDDAKPDRGRLAYNSPVPTDHLVTQLAGRINVDNDRYSSYVNADGSIKPSILDCPRFGIVPYFNVTDLGVGSGTSYYPVAGFVGVFIQEIETSKKNDVTQGNIENVTAQVIPFSKLTFLAPVTGDTIPYLGSGTRVPVLVK